MSTGAAAGRKLGGQGLATGSAEVVWGKWSSILKQWGAGTNWDCDPINEKSANIPPFLQSIPCWERMIWFAGRSQCWIFQVN